MASSTGGFVVALAVAHCAGEAVEGVAHAGLVAGGRTRREHRVELVLGDVGFAVETGEHACFAGERQRSHVVGGGTSSDGRVCLLSGAVGITAGQRHHGVDPSAAGRFTYVGERQEGQRGVELGTCSLQVTLRVAQPCEGAPQLGLPEPVPITGRVDTATLRSFGSSTWTTDAGPLDILEELRDRAGGAAPTETSPLDTWPTTSRVSSSTSPPEHQVFYAPRMSLEWEQTIVEAHDPESKTQRNSRFDRALSGFPVFSSSQYPNPS
ncbi:MAG: hypothetical protein ACRDJ4_00760 [Actinomycetota bacterium]